MLSPFDAPGVTGDVRRLEPTFEGETIGIVAGGGVLPKLVADRARNDGWRPFIVAVADGRRDDWSAFDGLSLPWRRTGDVFRHLQRAGAKRVVFCGTIAMRPDYRSMVPSLSTLRMLPEIFRIVRGGDDNLLRAASRAFEKRGLSLHGVQDIVPELLAPVGLLAGPAPVAIDSAALDRASRASQLLGVLDVGQAAVASAERVIALEGIEGTREMLLRVAELRRRGAIGRKERCVLFKGVKPGQDQRFDLPSVGARTLEEAAEAGLVGIGLSAGTSLILHVDDVTAAAARLGIFIVGMSSSGSGSPS